MNGCFTATCSGTCGRRRTACASFTSISPSLAALSSTNSSSSIARISAGLKLEVVQQQVESEGLPGKGAPPEFVRNHEDGGGGSGTRCPSCLAVPSARIVRRRSSQTDRHDGDDGHAVRLRHRRRSTRTQLTLDQKRSKVIFRGLEDSLVAGLQGVRGEDGERRERVPLLDTGAIGVENRRSSHKATSSVGSDDEGFKTARQFQCEADAEAPRAPATTGHLEGYRMRRRSQRLQKCANGKSAFFNFLNKACSESLVLNENSEEDDVYAILRQRCLAYPLGRIIGAPQEGFISQGVAFADGNVFIVGSTATLLEVLKLEVDATFSKCVPKPAITVCSRSTVLAKRPCSRTGFSVVSYEDKLYLFGGRKGHVYLDDLWCFDTRAFLWEELQATRRCETESTRNAAPRPRADHTAIVWGEAMYLFGGQCQQSLPYWSNRTARRSGDGGSRNAVVTASAEAEWQLAHRRCSMQGQITRLGDLWRFSFLTRDWSKVDFSVPCDSGTNDNQSFSLPVGRSDHTMTVVGDKIYIYGGMRGGAGPSDRILDDLWEFEPVAQIISKVVPKSLSPPGRERHVAFSVDGVLLVQGGYTDAKDRPSNARRDGRSSDLWEYSPSANSWRQIKFDSRWRRLVGLAHAVTVEVPAASIDFLDRYGHYRGNCNKRVKICSLANVTEDQQRHKDGPVPQYAGRFKKTDLGEVSRDCTSSSSSDSDASEYDLKAGRKLRKQSIEDSDGSGSEGSSDGSKISSDGSSDGSNPSVRTPIVVALNGSNDVIILALREPNHSKWLQTTRKLAGDNKTLKDENALLKHELEQLRKTLTKQIVQTTLSSAKGEAERRKLCVVCFARPVEYAFDPCGHACSCQGCARRLVEEQGANCPMCRAPIIHALRIHLP